MPSTIVLGDIEIDVLRRDIKNVHLSVYPPSGRVRIAAPVRMSLETIRLFAISKLAWIRQQQKKLRDQERESAREYINRESHYVWGKRCLLRVVEGDSPSRVELRHSSLLLHVRPGTDRFAREAILAAWYRQLLRLAVTPLIPVWERKLRVSVSGLFVQQMKTKWGSCNPVARTIRLNTELAKKPKDCLEYILVHEMAHLREPTHGAAFLSVMDRHMPNWRDARDLLNRLPARHEDWSL